MMVTTTKSTSASPASLDAEAMENYERVGRDVELILCARYLAVWAQEGPPGWRSAASCLAKHIREGAHRDPQYVDRAIADNQNDRIEITAATMREREACAIICGRYAGRMETAWRKREAKGLGTLVAASKADAGRNLADAIRSRSAPSKEGK